MLFNSFKRKLLYYKGMIYGVLITVAQKLFYLIDPYTCQIFTRLTYGMSIKGLNSINCWQSDIMYF